MKDPRVHLAHILECIVRIESYVQDGKDSFFRDSRTQDAVIRNFEVIGEAANRLPEAYRIANPGVPWRALSAFRNVLIHRYDAVSLPEIWQVNETELPRVKEALNRLLPPLEALEKEIANEEGQSSL